MHAGPIVVMNAVGAIQSQSVSDREHTSRDAKQGSDDFGSSPLEHPPPLRPGLCERPGGTPPIGIGKGGGVFRLIGHNGHPVGGRGNMVFCRTFSKWRDPDSSRGHHDRSEEHTSELQSRQYLVCRLLLEKKKNKKMIYTM